MLASSHRVRILSAEGRARHHHEDRHHQLGHRLGRDVAVADLRGGSDPLSGLPAALSPGIKRRERAVEKAGAVTPAEIRVAVKRAWKTITPDMCQRISKRVRKNMLKVIEKKGGNFFKD